MIIIPLRIQSVSPELSDYASETLHDAVREDGEVRALYSKIMDYMTFVTTEFDSYRKDMRWEGRLD